MNLKEKLRRIRRKYRHFVRPDVIKIGGVKVSTDLDDIDASTRLELYREFYEALERKLAEKYLHAGDRVLEIGAGVGYVGICCARICGPDSVLSYEPNKKMSRVIRKNYAMNGLVANLREKAINVTGGQIEFFVSDNIVSSSLYDRGGANKVVVECDAFADAIAEFNPTAIVMDVEGAEVELFEHCPLGETTKIILEVHPHIVGEEKISAMLTNLENQGFAVRERHSKRLILVRKQDEALT